MIRDHLITLVFLVNDLEGDKLVSELIYVDNDELIHEYICNEKCYVTKYQHGDKPALCHRLVKGDPKCRSEKLNSENKHKADRIEANDLYKPQKGLFLDLAAHPQLKHGIPSRNEGKKQRGKF